MIVSSEIARMFKQKPSLDTKIIEILSAESPQLLEEMEKQCLLMPANISEFDELEGVRQHLKHSPIGILYLILTDFCNIACRYCYFEGTIPKEHKFSKMDESTARRGVDLFASIMPRSFEHGLEEPQIIFYGGEPFHNWKVMRSTVEYIGYLMEKKKLPSNTSVTINTNGILITEEITEFLRQFPFLTLAVSVDGPKAIHDIQRVDRRGSGTFERVQRSIKLLRQKGINIGISCTLTDSNIDHAEEILKWLKDAFGVSSVGFNILMGAPVKELTDRQSYAEKTATKLISCFLVARNEGIYEDRIMRKVNSFVEGKIHFYDCGGCGQQIVISPDGRIGVCQAYCNTEKYFAPLTDNFDLETHPFWQEWKSRSPLNMPQCIDCVALGNCGGGCPYSAEINGGSIWSLDETFCVFSKKAIVFLVKELVRQVSGKTSLS